MKVSKGLGSKVCQIQKKPTKVGSRSRGNICLLFDTKDPGKNPTAEQGTRWSFREEYVAA